MHLSTQGEGATNKSVKQLQVVRGRLLNSGGKDKRGKSLNDLWHMTWHNQTTKCIIYSSCGT